MLTQGESHTHSRCLQSNNRRGDKVKVEEALENVASSVQGQINLRPILIDFESTETPAAGIANSCGSRNEMQDAHMATSFNLEVEGVDPVTV